MNPQYFFNNENKNNNNESRGNISPCGIFLCPRCVAYFSALEERDVHRDKEPFSLYNQEGREIMLKDWYKPGSSSEPKFTHTCCEKHWTPISNYYACATEPTLVTQMLLPPYNEVKPFDLDQFSKMAPIEATQMDAYFQHTHEMTPIMSNDHGIISMVPQHMTMDLLSAGGQPMAPIVPGCGAKRRSYQMDVIGQASAHASLALTLALPVPDIETEATTLTLGPPGLEKESTKKTKLDLNLKM